MGHPWKNISYLEKWVTLSKMGHSWQKSQIYKNVSHLKYEKRVRLENWSRLGKWVTLGKMGHTWKNISYMKKWVTLGKIVTLEKNAHNL